MPIFSVSFYFSFDIARRYAKHRGQDYLYATANKGSYLLTGNTLEENIWGK